mmetsp:Transcript_19493/g.32014  ORF Transcript_19493/g.32014 Transcript_19493/m.32014 type:complete len:210 (+) Transcript_19493:325-954(+)
MTLFHHSFCFILVIMWNIRGSMKQTSNTMATIGSYHRTLVCLSHTMYCRTQVTVQSPWLYHSQCRLKTFKCRLDDTTTICIDITDTKSFVQVTMVSSSAVSCYINIHDIPILNFSIVRNPVADYLVHTCTNGLWKVIVVERRGITITFHTCFMDNAINFICRHTHTARLPSSIQDFSSHGTCITQIALSLQLFRTIDTNAAVRCTITLL